ncbi:MAG: phosphate ABC transporter permease PstA, partial [Stackebrandtia sp.]
MTVTAPPSTPNETLRTPDLGRGALSPRRRAKDRAATIIIAACLLVAILPLGLVIYEVIAKGTGTLSLE